MVTNRRVRLKRITAGEYTVKVPGGIVTVYYSPSQGRTYREASWLAYESDNDGTQEHFGEFWTLREFRDTVQRYIQSRLEAKPNQPP